MATNKGRTKKLDLEKTAEKAEGIINNVTAIMQSGLIIAFFLIIDGITFILNPENTLRGMAQNIILIVVLAVASIFLSSIFAKPRNRKTIIISLLVLITAIIFWIFPDLIAAYLWLALSLLIIGNGLFNIANLLKFTEKISKFTRPLKEKITRIKEKRNTKKSKTLLTESDRKQFKGVDRDLNKGLEEQATKLLNPFQNMVKKSSKSAVLFIIANAISVIFGLVLLIYPDTSITLWGVIFLYTGLTSFIAGLKAMQIFTKIKEKRFKEIYSDLKSQSTSPKSSQSTSQKSSKPTSLKKSQPTSQKKPQSTSQTKSQKAKKK